MTASDKIVANNKIATVGAAVAAGAAVIGAAVESVPVLVLAAGVGIAASMKVAHHRQELKEKEKRRGPA